MSVQPLANRIDLPRLLVLGPYLVDRVRVAPGAEAVDHPGGNGLVVACVAARLGWPTTLVARLARDPAGAWLRSRTLEAGVALREQAPEPGAGTKLAEILVEPGGHWRTLTSRPRRYPYLAPPAGPEDLAGCGAVLLTGLCSLWRSCPEALADWLALVRAAGLPVVLGLNRLDPAEGDKLEALLDPADALFCSGEELCAWRGVAPAGLAAALALAPGGDLVVTLGAEGLWVRPRGRAPTHLLAEPVSVVNSLGAGDVLCAVTTVLRLAGVPLLDAVAQGQRAAGRSVRDSSWDQWLEEELSPFAAPASRG